MCNVSESTLSECNVSKKKGVSFWTAGQRIDPSRESTFVWRVTNKDGSSGKVSVMSYINWQTDEPNNSGRDIEACMDMWSGYSYKWNDGHCVAHATCSVCELEL